MRAEYVQDSRDLVEIGGRWLRDAVLELDDDSVSRIATGYMCIECLEPFSSAWPEVCPMPGCGFPVREEQGREFERRYKGVNRPDLTDLEMRAYRAGIYLP